MSTQGTDTRCLRDLQDGNDDALQELWQRYFHRVVGLARKRLGNLTRRSGDEEDVALSAFRSFWRGVRDERFAELEDRDDLWQLLVVLTCRKVSNRRKHEYAKCRDARRDQSMDQSPSDNSDLLPLKDRLQSAEPDPQIIVEAVHQVECLLDQLDDRQRQVVLLRISGLSNEEVSQQVGRSVSTVERVTRRARQIWKKTNSEIS